MARVEKRKGRRGAQGGLQNTVRDNGRAVDNRDSVEVSACLGWTGQTRSWRIPSINTRPRRSIDIPGLLNPEAGGERLFRTQSALFIFLSKACIREKPFSFGPGVAVWFGTVGFWKLYVEVWDFLGLNVEMRKKGGRLTQNQPEKG